MFNWQFKSYGDNYLAFFDAQIDGGFYRVVAPSQNSQGTHSESDTYDAATGSAVQQAGALVVFYSEHLQRSADLIVNNAGTISVPIFSFPGGRRFHFRDPCGNELGVWSDQ